MKPVGLVLLLDSSLGQLPDFTPWFARGTGSPGEGLCKPILPAKMTKVQPLLKGKTKVYVRNVYKHH